MENEEKQNIIQNYWVRKILYVEKRYVLPQTTIVVICKDLKQFEFEHALTVFGPNWVIFGELWLFLAENRIQSC